MTRGKRTPAKNPGRKPIPDKTKLQLWTIAGARCEFRGCNKPLLTEGLTLKRVNLSNFAHIIGASADGPRGDSARSKLLQVELTNLMLLCRDHHTLIDNADHIDRFPASLLRTMKREHESRIKRLLDISLDCKTTIVVMQSYIQGKPVSVDTSQVLEAVTSREMYPTTPEPVLIDLTQFPKDGDANFVALAREKIRETITQARAIKYEGQPVRHFSVFGLAPMPLLMALGLELADASACDLYQFSRKSGSWAWPGSNRWVKTQTKREPAQNSEKSEVAVFLALSDALDRDSALAFLRQEGVVDPATYELKNKSQSPYFLVSPSQITDFGKKFRDLLNLIKKRHGMGSTIHLFSAVPAPIAIKVGQEVLVKKDPTIRAYDYNAQRSGFEFSLLLHEHTGSPKP